MSLSAILDALMESGASVDQVVAATKAYYAAEAEKKARRIPWEKLRAIAFERDGHKCTYCDTEDGPFEIDHIIPRCKGGENTVENVCVACRRCNRSKKDREAPKL